MLRMVGFGDNAGSGFPAILETWKNNGWKTPELVENTVLNRVTLSLSFVKATTKSSDKKSATKRIHIDPYSVSKYQQSRCGSGRNKDGSAPIGMILPPQDEHLQTSLL